MSCIKTGGYFLLADYDYYTYGDLHSIGDCYVLYHTGKKTEPIDKQELDGMIYSNPESFDRDTSPHGVIVFPHNQLTMTDKLKRYLRH